MPDRPLVFDTVSLGNFLLTDSTGLLLRRYKGRMRITSQVLDELVAGMRARPALAGVHALVTRGSIAVADLRPTEHTRYAALAVDLGRGEASCIALAFSRGWTVVSDDRAARSHCAQAKLACTGTVGILKALCTAGRLNPAEADRILARMVAAGFYSPVSRISALLE